MDRRAKRNKPCYAIVLVFCYIFDIASTSRMSSHGNVVNCNMSLFQSVCVKSLNVSSMRQVVDFKNKSNCLCEFCELVQEEFDEICLKSAQAKYGVLCNSYDSWYGEDDFKYLYNRSTMKYRSDVRKDLREFNVFSFNPITHSYVTKNVRIKICRKKTTDPFWDMSLDEFSKYVDECVQMIPDHDLEKTQLEEVPVYLKEFSGCQRKNNQVCFRVNKVLVRFTNNMYNDPHSAKFIVKSLVDVIDLFDLLEKNCIGEWFKILMTINEGGCKYMLIIPVNNRVFDVLLAVKTIKEVNPDLRVIKLLNDMLGVSNVEEDKSKIFEKLDNEVVNDLFQLKGLERSVKGIEQQIDGLHRAIIKLGESQNNVLKKQSLLDLVKQCEVNLEDKRWQIRVIKEKIDNRESKIIPSMDIQTANEVEVTFDQANNTALGITEGETETVIVDRPLDLNYVDEILTDESFSFPQLTNRYLFFDRISLNRATAREDILAVFDLPARFVIDNWNDTNMLPFRSFAFYSGSLDFKIQANIPKTNQFNVRFGVVYHWLQRDRRAELINVHTISQMPGGRINGHKGSSDSIHIPYASYAPAIPIYPNSHMLNLYYCSVAVIAMTDYEAPPGAVDESFLNCYIKFGEDTRFYGQKEINNIPPTFTIPQQPLEVASPSMLSLKAMLAAEATKVAGGVTRSLVSTANSLVSSTLKGITSRASRVVEDKLSQALPNKKSNRDKAIDYHNPVLHQRAVTNMASGSGEFSGEVLRLESCATTPHPDFLMGVEKYSDIKDIIEVQGFINSFPVRVSDDLGTEICALIVQPGHYSQVVSTRNLFPLGTSNWAPVDHLAGWFLNFQGRIHYRFEVVADGFKTCRLRVAYHPTNPNFTFADSNSCYYQTYDLDPSLDAQLEFDFDSPYIVNQNNMNTRDIDGFIRPLGIVKVFVEIRINQPADLIDHFDLLVFKAAKKDEVVFSVPRNNCSLFDNTIGDLPDIPDTDPPPGVVYHPLVLTASAVRAREVGGAGQWDMEFILQNPMSGVSLQTLDNVSNTVGWVLIFTAGVRIRYRDNHQINGTTVTFQSFRQGTDLLDSQLGFVMRSDGGLLGGTLTRAFVPPSPGNNNITVWHLEYHSEDPIPVLIAVIPGPWSPVPIARIEEASPSMEVRELENDHPELVNKISLIDTAIHGESHMKLVDNLRRFEKWHSVGLNLDSSRSFTRVLQIPLNFGSPLLRQYANDLNRANKITHIHDAMRFTRGSLRYIINFATFSNTGNFRLKHLPQATSYPFTDSEQLNSDDYNVTGFGETYVSLSQNNTISIEIPNYLPTSSVLNASYLSSEFLTNVSQGLGVLEFYYSGPQQECNITIDRALGDDVQFFVFNGFPIRRNTYLNQSIPFNRLTVKDLPSASPSMFSFVKNFNQTTENIGEISNKVNDLSNFLKSESFLDSAGSYIITLSTQIAHIVASPKISTFIFSVLQVLNSFKVVTITKLVEWEQVLGRVWNTYFSTDSDITPSGCFGDDLDLASELSATLFSGVAAFFSVSGRPIDEKITFGSLYAGNMYNKTLNFFKTIFSFITRCVNFVCKKFFPNSFLIKMIEDNKIEKWINRVNVITDSTIIHKISKNRKAISLVYALCKQGEFFQMLVVKSKTMTKLAPVVARALVDIKKLRNTIGIQSQVPNVKFDPYCFYMASTASQIGKSEMLQELAMDMADENCVDIPNRADAFYVVPESDKWWSKYTAQKIIIFDDFGRVTRTEPTEEDGARLAGIKGAAAWEIPSPFEGKGTVSVAEIVACASNYVYPKVNGIKPSVLLSRRNIVFEVSANFSIYEKCEKCDVFTFGCSMCKDKVGLERLNKREHLSFQRKNPILNENLGERLTFSQMKEILLEDSKAYFKIGREKYAKDLERMKVFASDPSLSVFNVPSGCEDEYDALITDEDFDELLSSLEVGQIGNGSPSGGYSSKVSRDQQIYDAIKYNIDDDDCDIEAEECLEHLDIDYDIDKMVRVEESPIEGETSAIIIFEDNSRLMLKKCKKKFCMLNMMFESICIALSNKFKNFKGLPKRFVQRAFDKSRYIKELADSNSSKISLVLKVLAGIGVGCAIVSTLSWCFDDGETRLMRGLQDGCEQYVPTKKAAHPALSYSGDVLTKFAQKFKSKVAFKKKNFKSIAVPSVDIHDDYLSNLVNRCEKSTIQISYSSIQGGEKREVCVMRCVSVFDKIYATQLHSIMTILVKATEDIKFLERNRKTCTPECMENWPCRKSKQCTDSLFEQIYLEVKKVCKSGEELICKLRVDEFVRMSPNIVVDNEGSDLAFFVLNMENCTTTNIFEDLCSVKKYEYSSGNNFMILNVKNTPKLSVATEVKEVNEHIKYVASEINTWYKDGNLAVLVCGFVCKNPDPDVFKTGCGSLLIDCSTGTVIGIMSASSKKLLYFNAVTKEQMLECFRHANGQAWNAFGETVALIERKSNLIDIPEDNETKILGTKPSMNVYHAIKTTIRPSMCHREFGEVFRAPCHLSQDGDKGQTAMTRGLAHYKPHKSFDRGDIKMAINHVSNMFKVNCIPELNVVSCRNLRQAVCGIDGHIERICMSTSPGFPWCCTSKFKRKSDLLEFDDNHELTAIDKNLLMMINDDEEKMKKGKTPVTIFQLSLKDERLTLEKLDNVRLIQGSPLNLTISSRKYLMDFNYAFQISRTKLEHAVGINQYSIEWHYLTSELVEFSPYICVGDFSKFGPRLLSDFVRGAYQVMNEWYDFHGSDSEDHLVRKIIGERHIDSYNLCFDQIVKLSCGSPSGAINTAVVNTICNMFYVRCAWLGIFKEDTALSSLNSFDKYVKVVFYGDDLILSVKPEVKDRFNNQTMSNFFSSYGVKYTDVTKGDSMRKYCSIEEATFLKTGFTYNQLTGIQPGVWMPLPNIDDLFDTLNWVRKPKGCKGNYNIDEILKEAILQNCDGVIRKLWFHGRNTFEEKQREIMEFFARRNIKLLKLYDFDQLQLEYGYPISCSKVLEWG
jgi:hypothetical protein